MAACLTPRRSSRSAFATASYVASGSARLTRQRASCGPSCGDGSVKRSGALANAARSTSPTADRPRGPASAAPSESPNTIRPDRGHHECRHPTSALTEADIPALAKLFADMDRYYCATDVAPAAEYERQSRTPLK